MAIDMRFDLVGNPEPPTIILANRSGNKLGQLDVNVDSVELVDRLNDASEITFTLNKYIDGKLTHLWDKVVDFKLVYCKELDMWFEIKVELDEATETVKTVFCTQLGRAELSQIMLYNIEINTENDIARDEYEKPTVLYDSDHPEASLLHRIMEKAPHYSVVHVDHSIANMQRTFSFDGTSIYDAFQEISEELNCIFILHSNSGAGGTIQRTISVYDLESNCLECGHRGEFTRVCPECGSTVINEGYGNDTTIFVTSDELAENIGLSTDTDAIKNCFKLEAGDDLMTATIRNCNPNGTDYIWYISDNVKADMSAALVDKLEAYDNLYEHYQNNHSVELNADKLLQYNTLVAKYQAYNDKLETIKSPIIGYPALMNAYYNTVDLASYLRSSLMPTVAMSDTNALKEVAKLTADNLSPVSASSIANISPATADNAVLSMAKTIVDSRYRVKIETSSLSDNSIYKTWTGSFTVTNYSDDEDTASSGTISVAINDDYENFVRQKIEKSLNKIDTEDMSISGLFNKENDAFVLELKKYSLTCLTSIHNACQSCLDILIEQGVADRKLWAGQSSDLYEKLYLPYLNKLAAIEAETKLRQEELDLIVGVYDADGDLKTYGLQNYIEDEKNKVQKDLDFQNYVGKDLWLEFCAFRREDKYSNDNYISDGLNNAELFGKANEFIRVAKKEIYKSAELQHSISSSLKNLLKLDKFKPLVDNFQVGNWLRVMINDELYKLRLIEYTISYGNINDISVEFSDVVKADSTIKSVQDVISQATSMATSYESVKRQAQQGEESNSILNNWVEKGLDATNTMIIGGADNQTQTWDEHGMLFKKYDAITDSYDDIQLKIINSTMAITDDNWKTVKTAVGAYYYFDPRNNNKLTRAYGVNAETIVGKLILGEQLGIYNESGSLSFNEDGFVISSNKEDNKNSFKVNPNSDILVAINNGKQDVFYIDKDGKLYISGDGAGLDIQTNDSIRGLEGTISYTAEEIRQEMSDADDGLNSLISQTAGEIRSEVEDVNNGLSSLISQTAEDIEAKVVSKEGGNNESFGWSLLSDKFSLYSNDKEVFRVDNTGVHIAEGAFIGDIPTDEEIKGVIKTEGYQTEDNVTTIVDGHVDTAFISARGLVITDSNAENANILLSAKDNKVELAGWTVDASSLHTSDNAIYLGTIGTNAKIGEEECSNLVFKAGSNFGVTSDGALYANDANINGYINATGGNIGGCEIKDGKLYIANANADDIKAKNVDISGTIDAQYGSVGGWNVIPNGLYFAQTGLGQIRLFTTSEGSGSAYDYTVNNKTTNQWSFLIGSRNSDEDRNCNFGVLRDGTLYASGANISNASVSGVITANEGFIGGWSIKEYGMEYTDDVSDNVVFGLYIDFPYPSHYVGGVARSDWTVISGQTFGVTQDGALYATKGNIGGCEMSDGKLIVPAENISGRFEQGQIEYIYVNDASFDSMYSADASFDKMYAEEVEINGLDATNATIDGEIMARDGSVIGGFTISGSNLADAFTSLQEQIDALIERIEKLE